MTPKRRIAEARKRKVRFLIATLRRALSLVAADEDPSAALMLDAARNLSADQWATLAHMAGVNRPSPDTITLVLARLDRAATKEQARA